MSSKIALENGMSISVLLDQLEDYRKKNPESSTPILLMGYFNPVMQYGLENFLRRCQQVGVDGLIIPDLPVNIYQQEYKPLFEKYHVSNVFLVTPQTSEKRIREIDALTDSFIYAVSSASTTGSKGDFGSAGEYLKKLKDLNLKNAILTGFNIKTATDFETACKHVDGAIIGSEFIRQIEHSDNLEESITTFINSIRG